MSWTDGGTRVVPQTSVAPSCHPSHASFRPARSFLRRGRLPDEGAGFLPLSSPGNPPAPKPNHKAERIEDASDRTLLGQGPARASFQHRTQKTRKTPPGWP